jgi:hypothetical protein
LSVAQIGDRKLDLSDKGEGYAKYMRMEERFVSEISSSETIEEIIFTLRSRITSFTRSKFAYSRSESRRTFFS